MAGRHSGHASRLLNYLGNWRRGIPLNGVCGLCLALQEWVRKGGEKGGGVTGVRVCWVMGVQGTGEGGRGVGCFCV